MNGVSSAANAEIGLCRVLCFSPRHDLSFAQLLVPQIRRIVDVWVQQYQELGAAPFINWVQIFENRGAMSRDKQSASPLSDLGKSHDAE